MQLITVILLAIALWIAYQFYNSYVNIVKELKEIKDKCIKEGISEREAFVEHISENYVSDKVKEVRNGVLKNLKEALAKTS
jgi:hypothetical protein